MTGEGPIAIVGMGCRLAGATRPDELWARCEAGAARFAPVPPSRFDPHALAAELPADVPDLCAALPDEVALDWRTLRLPPVQAERLHLAEKLALQAMADALLDAGIRPGASTVERGQIWIAATTLGPDPSIDPMRRIRRYRLAAPVGEALARFAPDECDGVLAILDHLVDLACPPIEPDSLFTSASIVAGRASNLYDFCGGHAAVDVGMASSLAALREAAAALWRGECDLAVVCGVSPLVTPSSLLAFAHRGELAAVPVPFNPAGTTLGEGAAAVVLERLEDARARRIHAVVEAIAGAAEPGANDPDALSRCVARAARDALARAGARPDGVAAVASRAAGLAADAAEAAGLAEAYRGRSTRLPVGSCVPVTGFLQGASGLVALIQAALAVQRGAWPGPKGVAPRDPGPGLAPAIAALLPEPRRVAVSDAGPEPVAFHAIVGPAGAAAPTRARARPTDRDGFAIVGVGLVVPGANDVESYWRNVLEHADHIADLPRSRFDVDALVGRSAELSRAFRTRLAATVSPPPFDPATFGIPPAEAEALDPAVPIALLAAKQALSDSGWERDRTAGRRGQAVFGQLSLRVSEAALETRVAFASMLALAEEALREAGISATRATEILAAARATFDERGAARWRDAHQAVTGHALTARVAAAFGLGGIPLTVDAACASSHAAVLAACDALARGEADVALAGGVAHNLLPEYYVGLGLLGALSPRGGLPFHSDAEGFVPAEGAAAVVLKRAADARADGDRIYAVIRGHGVSSDGRGLSIYSPSSAGQQRALRRALDQAGVEPGSVDLVEAHGPGTHLGDRTEIASYAEVYGDAARAAPLVLSAAKSQVGHTTSASGLIALVRAALALHRRTLPPSNTSGEIDPELGLERIPARLGTEARPWVVPPGGRRRAGVSAFGMAGVNHHVILEEELGGAGEPCVVAAPPAAALDADRFLLDLVPLALPDCPPRWVLAGRRAVVLDLAGGPAEAVADALRARGLVATAIRGTLDGAALDGADLIVDVSSLACAADLLDRDAGTLATAARADAQRALALVRAAYARLEAAGQRPVAYVAATAMGGDLGLSGSGVGNVLGAFRHGMLLALKQELPAAVVKAMDFDPDAAAHVVADTIVREVEHGNDRVQIGWASRRFVVNPRRAPHAPDAPPLRAVRPGDVFVFSGGGRGVVFECACAVARLGASAIVTGRSPLPDPASPHLALDEEAFAAFRRREIVRRRGEPGLTPARFEAEMAPLVREREIHRSLARARAEGLALEYESCDVTNGEAVRALVARVRARHGRIDFLAHGAMVERSASVPAKRDEDVARTLDAKVAGMLHLLDATRDEPLRAIVAFGSGVARFGNRGQTDYAGANALLAALLPARAARRTRPVPCVTIDWPAWRETGWAAANPAIAAGLDAMGVTSISPEEGRYWFLSELAHGMATEVMLVGERMLHTWPFLGASADGAGTETDDRAALLVPGAYPLLGDVRERAPGKLVATRRLDPQRDLFLAQHVVGGRPVLPAAFALETLAEAAALARPGERVAEVTGFRVDAPVAVPGRGLDVRVEVVASSDVPGALEARLLSRLALPVGPGRDRLHASARVVLAAGPPASASTPPIVESEGRVRARSFYRECRDPVSLGPLFCRTRWVEIRTEQARATIEGADLRRVLANTGWPAFRVDPILLDSAFQVAGSLEGYGEGWVCVPMAVASLQIGRAPRPGERARARALRVRTEAPSVHYDVVVAGDDGALLLDIRGLELRRVARAAVAA